jgi:hypothetical protein
MKKFGLTLILFSIPLFILGGLGDYFYKHGSQKIKPQILCRLE